jgi:nucleoside-diphosphate-sugar epimerase
VQNPALTTDQNVMRTINLMTACSGNIKRFIFSSSSAIYGDVADNFPSKEDGKCNPASPYALQKLVVEQYCNLFYKLYDLESVCLRYFNVFGPGQLGDSPYSTAVSAWMDKLSKDLPLRSDGDGEQSRDLIYIDDVIQANMIAATSSRTMKGDVYNIGTGIRYTNNQILEMIRDRIGDVTVHSAPARVGDVKHTQADRWKAFDELGFKTKWDFESGLDKTISWWNLDEKKS